MGTAVSRSEKPGAVKVGRVDLVQDTHRFVLGLVVYRW